MRPRIVGMWLQCPSMAATIRVARALDRPPLLRVASQSFLNLPLEPLSGPRPQRRRLD